MSDLRKHEEAGSEADARSIADTIRESEVENGIISTEEAEAELDELFK